MGLYPFYGLSIILDVLKGKLFENKCKFFFKRVVKLNITNSSFLCNKEKKWSAVAFIESKISLSFYHFCHFIDFILLHQSFYSFYKPKFPLNHTKVI